MSQTCEHSSFKKSGRNRNGSQRYRCLNPDCKKYFSDKHVVDGPLGSMRTDIKDADMALRMLLEGCSIRSVSRLTGLGRGTISRLILTAGERCQEFLDTNIVDAPVTSIQLDELWSKIYSSDRVAKIKGAGADAEHGSSWTYVCLTDKKLAIHHVGARDQENTITFLLKVKKAIDTSKPFQASSDGWASYLYGVPFTLGSNVNFGMLIKQYSNKSAEKARQNQVKYSPASIIGAVRKVIFGAMPTGDICTSHVESFNQKMRMSLKRFTRLSNAISKKRLFHERMQSIYFAHFNFCRPHMSLGKRVTPAMASGLTDRPLQLAELLG